MCLREGLRSLVDCLLRDIDGRVDANSTTSPFESQIIIDLRKNNLHTRPYRDIIYTITSPKICVYIIMC